MKGALPAWLERLLGVDPAEVGEGTVWGLEHTWSWAPWATLLFVAFCVGLVGYVYFRDARSGGRLFAVGLAILRLGAIVLALVMIAELSLSRERTGLPYVVVLIDDSASMSIVDRYHDEALKSQLTQLVERNGATELSRLNLARAVLEDNRAALLAAIQRSYKLRVYLVADAPRTIPAGTPDMLAALDAAQPAGESSRLGDCIRSTLDELRGAPPAALILLSDGIVTEGERLSQAAEYAAGRHVPIYAVAIGTQDPVRNLRLADLLVDENVFVNDVVSFEAKLSATGLAGREVTLTLREEGAEAPLAEVRVQAGEDGVSVPIVIPHRPTRVGKFRYTLEAQALEDEDQPEDNREVRVVEVHEGKIKVLLVQSQPNFEFRRLKDMLERDETIVLHTVLQEADVEYTSVDRSALSVFPVRRDPQSEEDAESLFYYDVVIFGDVNPDFLSAAAMNNLADFVGKLGRGVVFVAGPRFNPTAYRGTPLATLLPVDLDELSAGDVGQPQSEPFQVVPTELGLASPHMQLGDTREETARIWEDFPELYWMFDAHKLKPAARVLAEHPLRGGEDGKPLPLFVMQYAGRGKVLFHASDETWRWRFRVGDVYFARYWVQTIRLLSRSKLQGDASAELSADRREYRRGEPVRLRLQYFDESAAPQADDGVTVLLERQGQKNRQLTLRRGASRGLFEAVATDLPDGSYHAWVAAPAMPAGAVAADFVVTAPPGEFRQVQMDLAELDAAVKATGGKLYFPHQASRLIRDLPEGRQVPIESLEPVVLWNKWPLVLAFVLLLTTEWIARKLRGLL